MLENMVTRINHYIMVHNGLEFIMLLHGPDNIFVVDYLSPIVFVND